MSDERNAAPRFYKVRLRAVVIVEATTPEEALAAAEGSQYSWRDWHLASEAAEAHGQAARLAPEELG